MRRTRARYGLHGAVEGMANNERGLRQSRTPHARSSCIIGHFLTIAWGTQILAIGGSQVRSYDRRTVSVEWSVGRANCKRFTHIRPTDGSRPTTVGWSGERLSMAVHGQTRMLNAPAVSKSFGSLLLLSGPEGPEPALGTTLGRLSK